MTPPEIRFWAKVDGGDVESCWTWTGRTLRGYGYFMVSTGVAAIAHRWAYEQIVGDIPAGLDLDHRCRNRACVNPWHLEPVTRSVNLRRMYRDGGRPLPTHCAQGHAFDDENTYRRPTGARGCRTCRNENSRAAKARKRAASAA